MKRPEKVYLIDTNVILRYLLGDHPTFSPQAAAFMQEVYKGAKKVQILESVLVECIYVMEKYYQISRSEIVDKLSKILNFSGIVNRDRSEMLIALLNYQSSKIDIVDCLLAARSSPSKIVISFDKDLQKLKAVIETL